MSRFEPSPRKSVGSAGESGGGGRPSPGSDRRSARDARGERVTIEPPGKAQFAMRGTRPGFRVWRAMALDPAGRDSGELDDGRREGRRARSSWFRASWFRSAAAASEGRTGRTRGAAEGGAGAVQARFFDPEAARAGTRVGRDHRPESRPSGRRLGAVPRRDAVRSATRPLRRSECGRVAGWSPQRRLPGPRSGTDGTRARREPAGPKGSGQSSKASCCRPSRAASVATCRFRLRRDVQPRGHPTTSLAAVEPTGASPVDPAAGAAREASLNATGAGGRERRRRSHRAGPQRDGSGLGVPSEAASSGSRRHRVPRQRAVRERALRARGSKGVGIENCTAHLPEPPGAAAEGTGRHSGGRFGRGRGEIADRPRAAAASGRPAGGTGNAEPVRRSPTRSVPRPAPLRPVEAGSGEVVLSAGRARARRAG